MTQAKNIAALQNCVIVRPNLPKHEFLVLLAKEHTGTGVVTAIGPNVDLVNVGDALLFGEAVGQPFEWQGENLLVMREEHVLGVFDA